MKKIFYILCLVAAGVPAVSFAAAQVRGQVPVIPSVIQRNETLKPNISTNVNGGPALENSEAQATSTNNLDHGNLSLNQSVSANKEIPFMQRVSNWFKIIVFVLIGAAAAYALYKGLQDYGSKK